MWGRPDSGEPACEEAIEEYGSGSQNIADIRIIDKYGEDISGQCVQIVLKIGYETIKKLAVMLMIMSMIDEKRS